MRAATYTFGIMTSPEQPSKPTPLSPSEKQHQANLKREAETEFGLTERGQDAVTYYDIEDIVAALRRARSQYTTPEST